MAALTFLMTLFTLVWKLKGMGVLWEVQVFPNCRGTLRDEGNEVFYGIFFICHIYPPFSRKQIVSLYFRLDVRSRLGVAIFEVPGPPVFHMKAGASR